MTEHELAEIEQRCLRAQVDQVGTLSFNAVLESARDVPALSVEVRRLRQALTDVCAPMQMFLRGIPEDQRRYVDSGTMVRLCDSVGFIQEIARKALEAE